MRAFILAALFSIPISTAALADENVAGNWHADLGSGIAINMNVTPDGGWSSETLQKGQVVRKMQGTYKQMPSGHDAGTLVFIPTQATVKSGSVKPETDKYDLADNGKELRLTSGGDTMVFEKRNQP